MSLGIEPPHVEEPQIGAAAAPGAEDPSADCQRLNVLEREFFHRAPDSKHAVWAKNAISYLPNRSSPPLQAVFAVVCSEITTKPIASVIPIRRILVQRR